jgi:putative ABC transport system permease protein
LRSAYEEEGNPNLVMVTALDTRSERASSLSRESMTLIRGMPGIAQADAETAINTHLQKRNGADGYTSLRGYGPAGFAMRPDLKLIAGRMIRPGRRELVVGDLARIKFASADVGGVIHLSDGDWPVVGVFSAPGFLAGDLIGDADVVMPALHRSQYNSLLIRLSDPRGFDAFAQTLTTNPALQVTVERESDYWRRLLAVGGTGQALPIAYVLSALIGLGAFAGLLQTMYGAVGARENEIAVLRALGFGGMAVAVSVVLEAMLLAVLGATLGAAFIGQFWSGVALNGAFGVFRVRMTGGLYVFTLSCCLAIALLGALSPAIKAARITVVEAFRAY